MYLAVVIPFEEDWSKIQKSVKLIPDLEECMTKH